MKEKVKMLQRGAEEAPEKVKHAMLIAGIIITIAVFAILFRIVVAPSFEIMSVDSKYNPQYQKIVFNWLAANCNDGNTLLICALAFASAHLILLGVLIKFCFTRLAKWVATGLMWIYILIVNADS